MIKFDRGKIRPQGARELHNMEVYFPIAVSSGSVSTRLLPFHLKDLKGKIYRTPKQIKEVSLLWENKNQVSKIKNREERGVRPQPADLAQFPIPDGRVSITALDKSVQREWLIDSANRPHPIRIPKSRSRDGSASPPYQRQL